MSASVILPCCCPEPPTVLESKYVSCLLPIRGWNAFVDDGSFVSPAGWQETKYYRGIIVNTSDLNGATETYTHNYDQGNGEAQLVRTDSGSWVGMTASTPTVSTFVSSTHWYITYASGARTDYYLENPITVASLITAAKNRFDALLPLPGLKTRKTFSLRTQATSTFVNYDWDFPSLPGGGSTHFSRIIFQPSRWNAAIVGGHHPFTNPSSIFPWDDTYDRVDHLNAPNLDTDEYAIDPVYGACPSLLPVWDSGAGAFVATGPSRDLSNFAGIIPGTTHADLELIKTCQSLPQGINCDVSGYFTDYELGDVALMDIDLGTYEYTQRRGELALAPGYYSFDGRIMHIHLGAKLNPMTSVAGIDADTAANYRGIVGARLAGGDPTANWRIVTDYCPP